MKHLWSPWRMKYITQHIHSDDCIFCMALEQEDSPDNLIAARGDLSFLILNRYPYTSGHLMIVPYEHQPTIEALTPEIRADIMEMLTRSLAVLGSLYHPDGYNLGVNIGAVAGAGVTGHVHFHVVPRWGGDTNFMSSVANTRVLPEDLSVTYHRIQEGWIIGG